MLYRSSEQAALVSEVIVDSNLGHSGTGRDSLDAGRSIAMLKERTLRRKHDVFALLGVGRAPTSASWRQC
jgi:hypothetical protein